MLCPVPPVLCATHREALKAQACAAKLELDKTKRRVRDLQEAGKKELEEALHAQVT